MRRLQQGNALPDMKTLSLSDAIDLCRRASEAAGASPPAAEALARASVDAEAAGQPNVGIAHLVDHLDALRAGRIRGDALPEMTRPAPALFHVDAGGGIAQLGFDLAFKDLVETARTLGIALFAQNNAYTCGSLGWFVGRLAQQTLVAIAATSGPALMAGSGGKKPVYCTNPLAFAAPRADGPPLLIDQASSATAFVNVRQAAAEGRSIPEGWAIDADGNATTDPRQAMKGALLAFGGQRGANIALMVEVLAAGLTGANWALDAPSFVSGSRSPGSGLLVIAIEPKLLDPKFADRMAAQMDRLQDDHGVHLPGLTKGLASSRAKADGIRVPSELVEVLDRWIAGKQARLHLRDELVGGRRSSGSGET